MSRRRIDRVADIREAVVRHLEADDPLAVSSIVDAIAGVIETKCWNGLPRDATRPVADAIATLVAALPEDAIAEVHAEAVHQGKELDRILIENAEEDARLVLS